MLKNITLLLFLSITYSFAQAQDNWFTQKLNDKVSVKFPEESKQYTAASYGVKAKDSTVYLVSIVDLLKATNMDLVTFNENVVSQTFANEFLEGLKPTMASFNFKEVVITTVKGLPAYIMNGRNENTKSTLYMKSIFVDGTAYTLACLISDGKNTKNKDKFLAGEIYINGK